MSDGYSYSSDNSYSSSDYSYSQFDTSTWYWSQQGRDRAQEEAISSLAAAQRSQQRRLERRRKEDQQRLAEQISSVGSELGSRVDTVLAWTELRFQLIEFDEYTARKDIRKSFRALAEGRPATVPNVADVLGYWLPPAAMAMLRLLVRDDAVARDSVPAYRPPTGSFTDLKAALASARERDPVRSELFNLAVGLCFEQDAFVDAAVLRLIGEPVGLGLGEDGQVAAGWRSVWEQTALGHFGPTAADQLADRLRPLFEESLGEDLGDWDAAIERFGSGDGLLRRTEAYSALREHLSEADTESEPFALASNELGGEARRRRSGSGEGVEGAGGRGDGRGPVASEDPRWRVFLQELIEEPSPAELPLVREMEELRLPGDRIRRSTPTWSEPQGTVAELVRRDLFDPEAPIALRRLALRLAGPVLRSRVEALGEASGTGPLTRAVKLRGKSITVDRHGPDKDELDAVLRRLDQDFVYTGPGKAGTFGLAAILGGVAALSLVLQVWFLAVVLAPCALIPLWLYRKAQAQQRIREGMRGEREVQVRSDIARAREQVREDERERDERVTAERAARRELLESLPQARPA